MAPVPRQALRALALALALSAPAAASAQGPMPAPGAGPPGISPVAGQDPTPVVLRGCQQAGDPQASNGAEPHGAAPGSPNPLAGLRFFVDPTEPAYQTFERYARRGQSREAELMWKVAGQPRFRWFGRWTRPRMTKKVREYLNCVAALQPGAAALMTVMRHQGKSCNPRYTAGGAAEDARTRSWYRDFAAAVGDARVVIAFEPDSLGTIDCLATRRRMARLRTLRYGVDVLSKLPNATIYLEGGASDWEPARRTARHLRYIGIHKVRGFMLNVTHYDWTANNVRHGLQISRLTGGKHFVVSTSFNGRGPVHLWKRVGGKRRRLNVWCHPMKRGLGPAPTTSTSHPKVDAYMWIGRPGYSGGACNGGPMPIGSFWPERALMFGAYATDWLRPPPGTKNGLLGSFSAGDLGYCGNRCT